MSGALSGATIDVGRPAPSEGGRPRRTRRTTPRSTLTPAAGLGLGIAMLWFSLLVLVPLSAIIATAAAGGWQNYVDVLQNPQTRLEALGRPATCSRPPRHGTSVNLVLVSSTLTDLLSFRMISDTCWKGIRRRRRCGNVEVPCSSGLPSPVGTRAKPLNGQFSKGFHGAAFPHRTSGTSARSLGPVKLRLTGPFAQPRKVSPIM